MEKVIFLTGATGLVGGNLIPRILKEDPANTVVLLVRARSEEEARHRVVNTLRLVCPELDWKSESHRLRVILGDVAMHKLGLNDEAYGELAETVTHIIHSAATVMFNRPLELVRSVNVGGTKNMIFFAKMANQHGQLRGFCYISTAYVSGMREGMIYEDELLPSGKFANSYEQAKYEAEAYVRSQMSELPITIFRPSIIVGDSKTGRTTSFNVLYSPLKAIFRGLVRFIPGTPSTPIDVVPVDFVCDALVQIFFKSKAIRGNTYHLTAGRNRVATAAKVLAQATNYFNRLTPGEKLSRVFFIPVPLYRALKRFLGLQTERMSRTMEFFLPYLHVHRTFDNSKTMAALAGTSISVPEYNLYAERILSYCLDVNWGKRQGLAA